MSGIYSVEDLLKLRASPLICKPPNLPPIEEWMGSQEPTAKRPTTRGRQEDSHVQAEGFQKRPTLDPSLRKSTTDPERIVLGPPKRSFASSNPRILGKPGTSDAEDVPKDGIGRHQRTRTGEDLENRFGDRRSNQFSGTNGKYSNRNDQDGDRPRRRHDDEDGEARPRKDHDRPRWGKEEKGTEEMDENGGVRLGLKRDLPTRSKFDQSWLRNDRGTEDARRETERSGWRRDRARDGEWDLPGKGDADPEWMDAPDAAEPAQAHTQEEFQRWKERMRAGANGNTEQRHEPPATIVASAGHEAKPAQVAAVTSLVSPDLGANSMDKFFAKFTEKRQPTEDKGPGAKSVAKSKFASLFGPPIETKPEPVPVIPAILASPIAAPAQHVKSPIPVIEQLGPSIDADQAGFKRILEMLGKRDTTPGAEAPNMRSNPLIGEQHVQERHQSPDLVALFKQPNAPRQTPASQPPPGLERLPEPNSPAEGHRRQQTPQKDELLLNLLRHTEVPAKPPQPQRVYNERPPPGLFPGLGEPSRSDQRQMHEERPDLDRPAPMQQRATGRSMFDDPAISGISYQDEMGARQGLQRRPTGGYDDMYFDRIRQQEQKPMQPPPGMARPPGLDQMPRAPPGWSGQPPPQHQQPRQGPPPPGMNIPRGMQPQFGAPQPAPMSAMPPQGQRPPQRKYTGDSSIPSFPPGIGPPPGFMNNGPPPGFHHNNASNPSQGYARYEISGEAQRPQQPPPNMGRAFMEMYGNLERGGLRGGNGGVPLPPGFR